MAFAYRNSVGSGNASGGALTVTKPSGTVDGDLIVVVAYLETDSNTWDSVGAGFNLVGQSPAVSTKFNLRMWWKWASGEPASWTWTPHTSAWRSVVVASYSGGSGSGAAVDVSSSNSGTGDTTQQTAPSVSTTVTNDLLVFGYGNFSGNNVASMTGAASNFRISNGGTTIADANRASTGATGTSNPTAMGTEDFATIHAAFFLSPAGAGSSSVSPSVSPSLSPSSSVSPSNSPSLSPSPSASLSPSSSASSSASPSLSPSASLSPSSSVSPSPSPSVPPVFVDNPVTTVQGTTKSDNLGPDGVTWASGHPLLIDKYGKWVMVENNRSDATTAFIYSNNSGTSWTDSLVVSSMVRTSLSYDSVNDQIHALWLNQAQTSMTYRRYSITRDGSNNITAITQITGSLALDTQTSGTCDYEHPYIQWLNDAGFGANGAVLAGWSLSQSGGTNPGNEVRTSMRVLSNDANDFTAANWKAPVTDDASSIGTDAAVPYTKIYTDTQTAHVYATFNRKISLTNALDVYVVYTVWTGSVYGIKFKRMKWNPASNDWSTGLSTAVTILSSFTRSGTNSGYSFKEQIVTDPREDVLNDCMFVGFSSWVDNTAGDSWSFVKLNANDTVGTIVDVYTATAANSGNSKFVTGDLAILYGYVVVSYTTLNAKAFNVQVFLASDQSNVQTATLVYNTNPVDIPTLYQDLNHVLWNNAQVIYVFRDFNPEAANASPTYTPPYSGYTGTLDWHGDVSPTGTSVWGQDTGTLESNVRNFAGLWTGTGSPSGTGNAEVLQLIAGDYMESEVINTGARSISLGINIYNTGDTVTIKYRTGSTRLLCEAASYSTYSGSFISSGFVQIRLESTL